uniref:Ig-like domain-containing protein n=1 Tax=Cyprinus carpio TaxID=7962 RepID=A0A8C1P064_CYPCA
MLFLSIFTHMCINTERPKPVVKVSPDERVFRGERVTLTCDIQRAGDIQWTYSWFKDGYTFYPHTTTTTTTTTTTAKISFSADKSDRAEYSCRGERSDSQRSDTSAAVTLTVSGESTLTVTPDSPVFTGETVTLKCVIETYSDWRYEWYKDSVMLQTSDRYTVNRDTLTIRGVITSDQGQYWCRGRRDKRPNSSQSNSAVYLSTKERPSLSSPHLSSLTSTVTLKCVIETHSDWRYEWYKDSVMLQTSDRYTVNRDTLTIRGVITSDQGQYWCRGQIRSVSSQPNPAVYLSVKGELNIIVLLNSICDHLFR